VNPEFSEKEHSLLEQVEESELVLDELNRELQGFEEKLGKLASLDQRYVLLGEACRSLEVLDDLGATDLFWGDTVDPVGSADRIHEARSKIDKHCEEIVNVEKKRSALIEKIGEQNLTLDCLHYDLTDLMDREEARQNEWRVERDESELPQYEQVMPWSRGYEEDQRFRKSLGMSVAASFALALLFSTVALPIIDRSLEIVVPERVAKLVQAAPKPKEPEPVIEQPVPEEEIPEPEETIVEELPDKIVPEVPEEPAMAAADKPNTKEQVKTKGILAFRDSFASRASLRPSANLGSQARISNAGENAVGRPSRSMVSTNAPGSSGGINLADISRDVGGGGGGGMEGVAVSRVASSIGGGGGTGDRPSAGGGAMAGRTDEEIQIVFDRYKASLYRLYNRELRKDPTLRGQMVIRLTIEPDGTVSMCELQSTDMNSELLSQQVVGRIGTFDFGAKEDIGAVTIIYPIDFLPAA
jgi:chorismate mutase